MQKNLFTFAALIFGVLYPLQSGQAKDLKLTITPEISVVFLGDTVQFTAEVLDSSENIIDTTLFWELTSDSVGSVDSTGTFIAEKVGLGFLIAFIGDASDVATVIVQDSSADSTGIQSIRIVRAKKNPKAPPDTLSLEEGSFYKLSRFQFPLNVVNGGILHFPIGSLIENILIEIELSSIVIEDGDSLIFPDSIINAVNFKVFVDDSLITPYIFHKPVKIAIPFKRGLLKKIGISPFEIGMYFFNDSSRFDSVGVTNIAVDTVANRIFADLDRFENIVLGTLSSKVFVSIDESPINLQKPMLRPNYPNPFNPVTKIGYTLSVDSEVSLIIYDLLGREVARLIDGEQMAGTHLISWDATNVSSGIYFYRLTAGTPASGFVQTRKMVLLK